MMVHLPGRAAGYSPGAVRSRSNRRRELAVALSTRHPADDFAHAVLQLGAGLRRRLSDVRVRVHRDEGWTAYATWLYGLHIYRNTFELFDMGYGATLAWILFILLSAFTFVQFRASRSWVFYSGEVR